MSTSLIFTLVAIVALLVISAFFSGSETALTAASRARIHRLAGEGGKRAKKVAKLIEDRERLIGGILLGNNLVNILASALATSVLITWFGDEGIFYATILMTALVLVFAEVMPKTYAITNPDKTALAVGPIIGAFVRILAPVVALVQTIVRGIFRLFGVDIAAGEQVLSAHEEIRGTIDLQAAEGGLRKSHRDMLDSILDLDEVLLDEVMVHRKSMMVIDADQSAGEIVAQVVKSPFTRLPLWQGNRENIIGVLHAKDVLRAVLREAGETSKDGVGDEPGAADELGAVDAPALDISAIMVKPWFVPETTTLREQLNAFLARRNHFALVVDEYGALMGLVTLEDILEEIVGEITDEFDLEADGFARQEDGSILVDGTATIRDLNRHFDWELPDEEATTIAGLVINEAETIPAVGDAFSFFGFGFEITARQKNQITRIVIRPEG